MLFGPFGYLLLKKNYFMKKIIGILLFPFSFVSGEDWSALPFSKITITSNSAVCEKEKKENKDFLITYKDNVLVKLAEQTNIKAGSLAITLKGVSFNDKVNKELKVKPNKNQKGINKRNAVSKSFVDSSLSSTSLDSEVTKSSNSSLDMFKKIELLNDVKIQYGNKFVTANKIEVFPDKKTCEFSGNIKIEQKKENPKDIPITAECEKAVLDMNTKEITLSGSPEKPVTTVIMLDSYSGVIKKVKTKEEKKAEKEALKKFKREEKMRKKIKKL